MHWENVLSRLLFYDSLDKIKWHCTYRDFQVATKPTLDLRILRRIWDHTQVKDRIYVNSLAVKRRLAMRQTVLSIKTGRILMKWVNQYSPTKILVSTLASCLMCYLHIYLMRSGKMQGFLHLLQHIFTLELDCDGMGMAPWAVRGALLVQLIYQITINIE